MAKLRLGGEKCVDCGTVFEYHPDIRIIISQACHGIDPSDGDECTGCDWRLIDFEKIDQETINKILDMLQSKGYRGKMHR